MTPEQASERGALYVRIRELIMGSENARDDSERDALLLAIARYQMRWVEPYARFCAQRGRGRAPATLDEVPALPTDAFRFARISSRAPEDDLRTFESSGTTREERGRHAFSDLSLYDLAAETAARHALFPERERMTLVILAPSSHELESSSLSYMLERFVAWFGREDSAFVWPVAGAELSLLERRLRDAEARAEPVALLGTSFAFVHALDGLGSARFRLPSRSRIMQTGGFKGRSREVAPEEMRSALERTFGVPEPWIVAEYGMTELSSQLYESTLRETALGLPRTTRRLLAPAWLRASVVDHETLRRPAASGQPGLVRLDDAANLDSIACLQTADIAVCVEDGFALEGRARGAVARGCSITADELLGGGR